jgi:IS30 family transposase
MHSDMTRTEPDTVPSLFVQPRRQIRDAVSVSQRPAEAEDRAVPGHCEGDLLSGSKNPHIATLAERQSRYVMRMKLDGKDTTTVVDALCRQVQTLPALRNRTDMRAASRRRTRPRRERRSADAPSAR